MTTDRSDPTTGPSVAAPRALQRAERGDHFCSFHASEEEQRRLVSAFLLGALGEGARVMYVAHDRSPRAVAVLLHEAGVRPDGPVRSGQVLVLDFAEVYGEQGEMDVDAVLGVYGAHAEQAHADGFPELRIAVEMGDFVGALGSVDAVADWERTVTRGFAEVGITGLCQYDRRVVGEQAWAAIAAAHPLVATDDRTAPVATITATDTPWGLKLAGELDVTIAAPLARALTARASVGRRVHVDLGDVRFADVGGLRVIYEVARTLPPDSVLVLHGATAPVRRVLELVRWHDARVRLEDK